MESSQNKSNVSTDSSATTSSDINSSFKFTNLSFLDNADPLGLPEVRISQKLHPEKLKYAARKPIAESFQMSKPAPNKILPGNLYQLTEEPSAKDDEALKEKTLMELGFKPNEIEGWESINQPPKQNLYDLLKNMIDNYIKPNVQVRIGDVTFNCHMMVLQCYSDFFMEGSNEVIVQLPPERITPQAFMMAYDWMLSAEPLVQREGILELFNAANFLKIKGLVDQCWVCLDDDIRFQEDTAFLLYLEARNYGLDMLQQLMLTRICKFFLTLVASKDFLLLSVKEVCTLLSSNSIGVNSEVEILMSAVRWLSYDWNERQAHMLDVLKCVRFGLVPPWILVALGRDTDCIGVERVIDNPQVKKMIEDGLSYTTTQLFYSDNVDNFLAFLERYQLTKPVQRQWICDQECNYHHNINCPNRQYITYDSFLEYLEMIRTRGKDHWKTMKMENQEGLNFQCCLPKANALGKDQYICCVTPKESRDQGVQASGSISDFNETDIKASWYQEIYASSRTKARSNFELPNTPKRSSQSRGNNNNNNNNNKNSNNSNNSNTIATKEDNKSISLSQKATSCCDVNQKAINIKKSILAKSYYCSMSSQDFQFTMANSLAEVTPHQNHPHYGTDDGPRISRVATNMSPLLLAMQEDERNNDGDDYSTVKTAGRKQIVPPPRKQESRSELNFSMMEQKIFIFGGIDPYAQRLANGVHGADVLYYDGCENAWKYLSNMPGSRHHHSAIVLRGRIYVVGGTRPALAGAVKSVFETAVWSFDPKRLEWHNECTLPQPRRDFGLIAYDNDATNHYTHSNAGQGDTERQPNAGLYIIGGESIDGTPLSSMLHYNVEDKIWSEKASLNVGRYGLVSAVVATKNTNEIWIAGGVYGQKMGGIPMISDTVECYNLSTDDGPWKLSVKRLRIPRLFARFCTTGEGNDLYIIGGIGLDQQRPGEFLSLSSVDRYDFLQERWIHFNDMATSRHGHDAVSVREKILIFGGVSPAEKKALKSVECFSTKTSNWVRAIAHLPSPLSGLAAVVIDSDMP